MQVKKRRNLLPNVELDVRTIDPSQPPLHHANNLSRILVVTDDQRLNHMLCTALAGQGHQVVGIRGLTDVSNGHNEYEADLVLFDLGDSESGLDFLRSDADVLPVVVICNHLGPEIQAKAKSLGIYNVLEKPVDSDQLLSAVERELQCRNLACIAQFK